MQVRRTERIRIKFDKSISNFCHIAKNLYNEANYIVRQEFINNRKWIRYNELYKMLKDSDNFKRLSSHTSQQILRLLDKNWSSFFRAIKEWSKNSNKFNGRPSLPKYKKKNGEFMLIFTNQQCRINNGWLKFPKKFNLKFKTRIKEGLQQVRIIPKGIGYLIEIIYKKTISAINRESNRVIGIDIGLNNLVTIVNNIGLRPIVVKGGILKSINQHFNKTKSELQSIYDKQKIKYGKKQRLLESKRYWKIHDYFHKLSKFIIDYCKQNNIDTVILGWNKNMKQRIRLGKRTNQSFVLIPFYQLRNQIKYKCEDARLRYIETDESYTSKCSFLDNEPIRKHEKYKGERIKRGLYRTAKGKLINADVNAAYNIIRKAIPKMLNGTDGIEGVGLHPLRCNFLRRGENNTNLKHFGDFA